jgi:hypothetical protein
VALKTDPSTLELSDVTTWLQPCKEP